MHRTTRIKLADLNPHLTCMICKGYFVDATTIIECLHSFCKTCIVKYLETNKFCPVCDVQIHKTRPLLNIRSDQTLQDIVYKLVPGLFKNEMKRRREFYAQHPEALANGTLPSSSEERGDVRGGERLIFTPEDIISVSLEYCPQSLMFPPGLRLQSQHCDASQTMNNANHRRFLRCPAAITVSHLKKLLRAKYGLSPSQKLDILYMHDILFDDYRMMDLAYIYSWRRNGPLRLFYEIYDRPKKKMKSVSHTVTNVTSTESNGVVLSKKEDSSYSDSVPELSMTCEKRNLKSDDHQEKEKTITKPTSIMPSLTNSQSTVKMNGFGETFKACGTLKANKDIITDFIPRNNSVMAGKRPAAQNTRKYVLENGVS